MAKKRILFINQEIVPYVPASEMANMGRNLPQKMQEKGFEIRTFMPKWGNINERRGQLHEVIRLSGMNIVIDETDHPLIIKVASIPVSRLQVYFIDNEDYFIRRQSMTEDENGEEYTDNGERAIFFARGVLETVKKLRWTPDIIHCQGWMAGVIPLYIKTAYHNDPTFANAKVVTSLFHNQFKASLGDRFPQCVNLGTATADLLNKYSGKFDFIDFGKMAIDYSDGIVIAAEHVNQEIADYARNSGRPVLEYPGEDYAVSYKEFYDKILAE